VVLDDTWAWPLGFPALERGADVAGGEPDQSMSAQGIPDAMMGSGQRRARHGTAKLPQPRAGAGRCRLARMMPR